ncbi:MAG TPA: extracellular solute-binding protein [Candidatus Binataceae bacterium]|jgi:molybdate/tungstate transport system substrate-binding protein|nr:extracellular solute-binding protein [Candidatus Binataceae bacterium]
MQSVIRLRSRPRPVVWITVLGLLLGSLAARAARAATPLRVAYAGSMGTVMDQQLGPAFAKANGVEFQGIGQAAYALAHLLESKQMQADVFVSVTSGPMRILLKDGLVREAPPVAGTQMALAYSPQSRFAKSFAGKQAWYEVLESPGLRFGRTDPATDPQGRNVIFTLMLAERYYHAPGLAEKILGPLRNSAQLFAEPSLLTRLEAGQIDATVGYLSAIKSEHLPFVELPPEINLSNPADFDAWYSKASFTLSADGKTTTARPEPLVFYAAVLANAAHPEMARKFVRYLAGPEGQRILRESGYDPPVGPTLR